MDLPTFDSAAEQASKATEAARNAVQSRISILQGSNPCENCGSSMEATTSYDPVEGAFYDRHPGGERPTWYCSECDTHFRREKGDSDVTFSVWD